MKKRFVLTVAFASIIAFSGLSQSSSDFHLGVGFNPTYEISDVDFFDDDVIDLDQNIPHILISWDRAVVDEVGPGRITAGGFIGYASYSFEDDFSGTEVDFNFLNFGARGAYALYPLVGERIEPYGGFQLIYNYLIVSSEEGGLLPLSSNEGEFDFSFFVGSRFLITDSFGVFAEIDPLFITVKAGLFLKKF